MNIIKNQKHSLTSLAFLILMLFGLFGSTTGVKAENGQALSISPPVLELSADPGQTVVASIKLTNISSEELLIKNQVNDFGAKNETGEPNIIFEDTESTSYSLKNWITAPPPFKIASRETKTVDFPIKVPANAEPGGHYAVVRFTGQAPELEDTGVALSASLGSLVLLKVSGETKEQASITEFFSAGSDYSKTSFFEYPPINFVERIHNDGNVHVNPSGTIEIFDIFGRKVGSAQVNGDPTDPKNKPRAILPNSTRRFEQTYNSNWMIGPYTAKLKLNYGKDNQNVLASSTMFWVIPYKQILLAILILILLILLIRFINKRYKQRIIKKYTGGQAQPHSSADKNTDSEQHTPHSDNKSMPPQKLDLRSTNKPKKPNPPHHK